MCYGCLIRNGAHFSYLEMVIFPLRFPNHSVLSVSCPSVLCYVSCRNSLFLSNITKILCDERQTDLTNEKPTWCHLLFYFTYYALNMFRTLIYRSSEACDCVDELPHRSSCSQFVVSWSFCCGSYLVVFVLQVEALELQLTR